MAKKPITFFSKAGLLRRWLVLLAGMLCSSSALALSYSIADGYGSDPTGMCQAVRKALAESMVLDAKRPLCARRFELSPKAKSLGLSGIDKTLLPASSYPDLLRKMMPVYGKYHIPLSDADQKSVDAAIDRAVKSNDTNIYAANFDEDNSGKIHKVYLMEETSCVLKDAAWDGNFTIFVEKNDGSLDTSWDVDSTGIPFTYNAHTYYMKWKSLNGNLDKRMLAQLDVYDAVPFHPELKDIVPHSGFTPSYCIIYQAR